MRKFHRIFFTIFITTTICLTSVGQVQRPVVSARFSTDSIMIGDQFYLDIKVDKDQSQMTGFPVVGDTLIPGIEVLKEFPIDTVNNNGRQLSLVKRYLLTSFDNGYYSVKYPVLYVDKNITDTIFSQSNKLFVNTFEIDTTKQQIYDIRPPQKMPLKFGEISGYLAITILVVALMLVLIRWLIKRYRNRKTTTEIDKPKEAPEVIAIRALEELQNEKLWQNNRHKLYYTRLTDIIRTYIDQRWDINSMEMTSSETLSAVNNLITSDVAKSQLSRLLTTADYVKFAKYKPEVEDNEMSWNDAYYFVEQTKQTFNEQVADDDQND